MVFVSRKAINPGNRLRVLRAQYDLSQMEVAAHLGVGHNRYWRIENGFQDPTPAEQVKLARLLKTTVSDIFPKVAA
jgi:transcriptional regulator with XRE-family HTH domain